MKCMCKANDPDPDIREEYCDGATMLKITLNDVWYYCFECGKHVCAEVSA